MHFLPASACAKRYTVMMHNSNINEQRLASRPMNNNNLYSIRTRCRGWSGKDHGQSQP